MKLSKIGLLALRGTDIEFRKKLAQTLGIKVKTLYAYIANNDENLTKAAALILIRRETGLADDILLENAEITIGQ